MLEWKELRFLEWREFRVKCFVGKELRLLEWKELGPGPIWDYSS